MVIFSMRIKSATSSSRAIQYLAAITMPLTSIAHYSLPTVGSDQVTSDLFMRAAFMSPAEAKLKSMSMAANCLAKPWKWPSVRCPTWSLAKWLCLAWPQTTQRPRKSSSFLCRKARPCRLSAGARFAALSRKRLASCRPTCCRWHQAPLLARLWAKSADNPCQHSLPRASLTIWFGNTQLTKPHNNSASPIVSIKSNGNLAH